ncbi:MAG: hypothetical protein HQM08_30225 [Candidatus Riflebacteria bacterium]|nr:hypothetical protein [Candidatus Riflebacteria bacterium]
MKKALVGFFFFFSLICFAENPTQTSDETDFSGETPSSTTIDTSKEIALKEVPQVSNESKCGPKIKGLFLGMDFDTAHQIFVKLYGLDPKNPEIKLEKNEDGTCSFYSEIPFGYFRIKEIFLAADKEKKVTHIRFPYRDDIFNTPDLDNEGFVQQFVNSYNIPGMKGKASSGIEGKILFGDCLWEYLSPEGYKLTIGQKKSIELEIIPKATERKFD